MKRTYAREVLFCAGSAKELILVLLGIMVGLVAAGLHCRLLFRSVRNSEKQQSVTMGHLFLASFVRIACVLLLLFAAALATRARMDVAVVVFAGGHLAGMGIIAWTASREYAAMANRPNDTL